MNVQPRTRTSRRLIRALAALGIAVALGGCVVVPVPVGPPGYHRPHHYRYW